MGRSEARRLASEQLGEHVPSRRPAWTLDETTGQYYLHNFLPDAARSELVERRRPSAPSTTSSAFWFDRGVAGFRLDVAHAIVKDHELRDDPLVHGGRHAGRSSSSVQTYSMHRPEVHDVLRRWRAIADEYDPPRVLIGETWVRDLPELARYYGEGDELHLAFNFAFAMAPFEAVALRDIVEATERALGPQAWPLWTASNHDIGRLATRWAAGDEARAGCALFVLLLLRGTPVLYAGDEIGLEDVEIAAAARRDPGSSPSGETRDGARTPMIWEPGDGHGFTRGGVEAWLPFGGAHGSVDEQRADPSSVLSWCRQVIQLRRATRDLTMGDQRMLGTDERVLAWRRGAATAVAANLSARPASAPVPAGEVLLASPGVQRGSSLRFAAVGVRRGDDRASIRRPWKARCGERGGADSGSARGQAGRRRASHSAATTNTMPPTRAIPAHGDRSAEA